MDFVKLSSDTITDREFSRLVYMEETCGLEPYTPQMLRECISELDTYTFVDGETICGFITLNAYTQRFVGGIYIVNLNIAQDYRRQGWGQKLICTALAQYKCSENPYVTLDVEKTNTAAINLYQKLGFKITEFPSMNGETDYVMIARLYSLIGALETPRLVLRPISLEDLWQLSRILTNDIVKKTYMLPDLSADAALELARKIALLSADSSRYVRGVYLGDTLIGCLNDVEIKDGSIELGWAFHPDHYGHGFATEAVKAAITDLFHIGYSSVVAGAFAQNTASLRVMQKCGMQLQELTEDIAYRGKTHKCIYYAIRRQ